MASPLHGVDHYENFPVASWLMPARLRPAVVAIYRFARHADDLADEGDALPATRVAALQSLVHAIDRAESGHEAGDPQVQALVSHVHVLLCDTVIMQHAHCGSSSAGGSRQRRRGVKAEA